MKRVIQPGASIDFLSPEEFLTGMKDHTDHLLTALGRNAQFKRIVVQATADASGVVLQSISPPDGFMWDVRFMNVYGYGSTSTAYIYMNTATLNNLVDALTMGSVPTTRYYSRGTLILHGSDSLIVGPSPAITPGGMVSISLHVVEVPRTHEAQLLL